MRAAGVADVARSRDAELPARQVDVEDRAAAGRASKPTLPPSSVTICLTMLSPSPVPPFWRASVASAWANFSKMRGLNSSGMPGPWSRTVMRTSLPALLDRHHDLSPRGENLIAFDSRLVTTCDEPVGIGAHDRARRTAGSSRTRDAVALGKAAVGLDRLLDQRAHVDALEVEHDLAGLDLLDVENVVDQPHQPLAVLVRDLEQPHGRLRQLPGGAAGEQPERARDRGERRAQLVADGRDEFVLEALDALALADVDDHAEDQDASRMWIGLSPTSTGNSVPSLRTPIEIAPVSPRCGGGSAAPIGRMRPQRSGTRG